MNRIQKLRINFTVNKMWYSQIVVGTSGATLNSISDKRNVHKIKTEKLQCYDKIWQTRFN